MMVAGPGSTKLLSPWSRSLVWAQGRGGPLSLVTTVGTGVTSCPPRTTCRNSVYLAVVTGAANELSAKFL